jgi:methionyl-tRNA formyltransferase
VVSGETETGVTIMHMAQELDAGDIIDQIRTPIDPDESVEAVHDRLAQLGGKILVDVVKQIGEGTATRTPQDSSKATYAPMLSRELSNIDWDQPAKAIHDKIRGLSPWPAASTNIISDTIIKIFGSSNLGEATTAQPGTIVAAGKQGIDVACGDGKVLRITQLQAPGGKRMAAADYLRGHPITV